MEPAPPLGDAPITAMERGVNKGSSFQGDFFTGDSFVRQSGECLAAFWFGTPAVFYCSLYELKFIIRKYEVRQKKSSGRGEKGKPCRKIFAFPYPHAGKAFFARKAGCGQAAPLPPRLAWGKGGPSFRQAMRRWRKGGCGQRKAAGGGIRFGYLGGKADAGSRADAHNGIGNPVWKAGTGRGWAKQGFDARYQTGKAVWAGRGLFAPMNPEMTSGKSVRTGKWRRRCGAMRTRTDGYFPGRGPVSTPG